MSPKSIGLKQAAIIYLKGMCMGMADIIPGVSGGTMAFILGIYERFVNAIKSFDARFFRLMIVFKWADAFRGTDFVFLAVLVAGILSSILTMSHLLESLLVDHQIHVYGFFFGLILASIWIVIRHIRRWNFSVILSILISSIISYVIVGMAPVQTTDAGWFLFLCGALAICAMVLPGISGAFVLLLLGKYQTVITAVNERDLVTIALVGSGVIFGVMTFARVVSWLFKHHHNLTVAVLTGLMTGSLRKIWPWKKTLRYMTDRHGDLVPMIQQNILPEHFTSDVVLTIVILAIGVLAGVGLEFFGQRTASHE